jgi:hypothetical protein
MAMKIRIFDKTDTPIIGANMSTFELENNQILIMEGQGAPPNVVENKPLALVNAIETPAEAATLPMGAFKVIGYASAYNPALTAETVYEVELLLNGATQGRSSRYGLNRSDVTLAPEYVNKNIGFEFDLNTANMAVGSNQIILKFYDRTNAVIGVSTTRTVTATKDIVAPLRWAIDTPIPEGAIQDTYRFEGWAVQYDTPNARDNITTIDFLMNGTPIGTCTRGKRRPDVLAAYPDIVIDTVGWFFDFNSTPYPNGRNIFTIKMNRTTGGAVEQGIYARIMTNSTDVTNPPDPVEDTTNPPAGPQPETENDNNAKAKSGVNFRSAPSTSSTVIRKISTDEVVTVVKYANKDWLQIRDKNDVTGYADKDYFVYIKPSWGLLGDAIIMNGMQYEGRKPDGVTPKHEYAFGSAQVNPTTFDCSGFVAWVVEDVTGIDLPNASAAQALKSGTGKTYQRIMNRADLKKGDIMFFDQGDRNDADKQKPPIGTGTREDPYTNYVDHVGFCAADGATHYLHTYRVGVGVIYQDSMTSISTRDNVTTIKNTKTWGNFLYGMRIMNANGTGWIK